MLADVVRLINFPVSQILKNKIQECLKKKHSVQLNLILLLFYRLVISEVQTELDTLSMKSEHCGKVSVAVMFPVLQTGD